MSKFKTKNTSKMKDVLKYFVLIMCVVSIEGYKFRCDYKRSKTGWFKYHNIPLTWNDARLMCQSESATLASSTGLMRDIMKLSNASKDLYTGLHARFSGGHYYSIDGISLNDMAHEWSYSEPDNKDNEERCISINTEGQLSDIKCDSLLPYMCYRGYSNVIINECGTVDQGYSYNNLTKKCYKYHTNTQKFENAHFICSAEGGHLVILDSQEEANVIREISQLYPTNEIRLKNKSSTQYDIYIGILDWDGNCDWRTIHGRPVKNILYTTFKPGEPNNSDGNENCVIMMSNGLLNDVDCNLPHPFICEKEPNYPPICDTKCSTKNKIC